MPSLSARPFARPGRRTPDAVVTSAATRPGAPTGSPARTGRPAWSARIPRARARTGGLRRAPEPTAAPLAPLAARVTGATTLGEMVLRAGRRGSAVALRFPCRDGTAEISYAELTREARAIARGLVALGIGPGDRVALLGSTSAKWTLCDLGALCSGAVVAPVYHTNSPAECRHVLADSQARLVFCEDAAQAAKIAAVREQCPALEHVVVFDDSAVPGAITLSQLRRHGAELPAGVVDERIAATTPDDLATLVYTSGTTGPAKGCRLTHANFLAAARMCRGQLLLDDVEPVIYMFLPLAHVLARLTQAVVLDVGGTIAYWGGDSRRIVAELAEVAPTHFPAVPRVYEKLHTAIVAGVQEQLPFGGAAALRWALAQGARARAAKRAGRRLPLLEALQFGAADRLILARVRRAFGHRLVMGLVGAAPIAADLIEFYDACGVLLLEGYGMTESCSTATLNPPGAPRAGTVGRPLPESEVLIAPDGEVLLRGPHVFDGYFGDDVATAAAFDADGWLHTGDLGSLTDEGYLRIIGRTKDLIITSSGKNITPTNIESALRETRWISEAVVYGDSRPYLVCVVTLDGDEAPKLALQLGISADPAIMARDERVRAALQTDVDAVNLRFARIEQVKRFAVLDHELSQAEGELTPTLKIKRNLIYAKYAELFDSLYAER